MNKTIRRIGFAAWTAVIIAAGSSLPAAASSGGTSKETDFDVIELRSDKAAGPRRVAVIVLSYNDHWTSWAGEWLYEGVLRTQLGRRYSKLYVARGKKLNAAKVRKALRAALLTGSHVDVMTTTHSSSRAIMLDKKTWITPDELFRPVLEELGPGMGSQLDFAANFGCYGDTQADQWSGLGFRSYVAHKGVSAGAVAMSEFLKRWVQKCDDVTTAVSRTDSYLKRLFTKNFIAKLIYKALANGRKYEAVMMGFGANQSFCE